MDSERFSPGYYVTQINSGHKNLAAKLPGSGSSDEGDCTCGAPQTEGYKNFVEAQKRWRTLRDNFKRELKHQKSVEMGEVAARRKKYKHYDLLQFLEPIMNRRCSCDYSTFRNELDFNREDEEDTTGCEETMGSFEGVPDYAVQDYRQDMEVKFSPYPIPTAAHFDPDEMFFYSMLPAFKRLTERQKSLLKVKITQLMHDTIYSKEGDESTSVESTVPQRNSDSTTS
ncbi:hypothetical protein AAG570_006914 [Ranatra chinensis]|uniref:BESS domain-containing protein n=1 Tax=Ranatra chinensis TaxID=642074 RepID=A0ABD0YVG8_9HEMI